MSRTIHQHVVSRFLLVGFADPPTKAGVLWELDKHTGDVVRVSSKRATVIDHYYDLTVDFLDEDVAPDLPEQALGRIEDAAAPVVRRLRETGQPIDSDSEELAHLALFVAMAQLRTPRAREEISEMFTIAGQRHARETASYRPAVEKFLRESGDAAGPKAVDAMMARLRNGMDKVDITAPIDRMLGSVFEMAFDIAAMLVMAMSWTLRVSDDASFVIADTPVSMFDRQLDLNGPRGNGWRSSPYAQAVMPIGSHAALVITPGPSAMTVQPAGARLVENLNLRSYSWADRYIYGRSRELLSGLHSIAITDAERMAPLAPQSGSFHFSTSWDDGRPDDNQTVRPSRAVPPSRPQQRRRPER